MTNLAKTSNSPFFKELRCRKALRKSELHIKALRADMTLAIEAFQFTLAQEFQARINQVKQVIALLEAKITDIEA